MRDFINEIFSLPTYKWWNIFMLGILAIMPYYMNGTYLRHIIVPYTSDFYILHMSIFSGISLACMIILYINRFRGSKCWHFLGILCYDTMMFSPLFLPEDIRPIVALMAMVTVYVVIYIVLELVSLRKIRLGFKFNRWNIIMKVVNLIYLFFACNLVLTFVMNLDKIQTLQTK